MPETSPEAQSSVQWTVDTLHAHFSAQRENDLRLFAAWREGDQKALEVKEVADVRALDLARARQDAKDEAANELRAQIERERGTYVTKTELALALDRITEQISPIATYITNQQGHATAVSEGRVHSTSRSTTTGLWVGLAIAATVAVLNLLSRVTGG